MKFHKCSRLFILSLFVFAAFMTIDAPAAFCQSEKLGIVHYTPVAGWEKTLKDNVVGFSEINKTTGAFCIITLYGATTGTGTPEGDFAREWKNLVVKTMDKAEADPTTDKSVADGWTKLEGGSTVETQVGKAAAFLSVRSGFGQTVSILAVFSDAAYVKQIDAFVKGIDLDKPAGNASGAGANQTTDQPPARDSGGKLIIPILRRDLTLADLAGEWGDSDRIATTYVYKSGGGYAGTDSLAYKSKWTIKATGAYTMDFFQIRNREKLSDLETGTISVAGRVVTKTPKEYGVTRFVVIGWLDLPDMTLMTVSSTYFKGNVIPDSVLNSSDYREYSTIWVRKK